MDENGTQESTQPNDAGWGQSPQSPAELWTQIVGPLVETKLRSVPSRAPAGVLPHNFHATFLDRARANFEKELRDKSNFLEWFARMKDWGRWSNALIPFEEINPQYVQGRLNEICYTKSLATRVSGLLPETVRRVLHMRPRDITASEFFENVLSEAAARFMKQYFSSFQEPMGSWLYKLTASAALDYVKKWVPDYRGKETSDVDTNNEMLEGNTKQESEEKQKRRKGVVVESIDIPLGESGKTLSDTLAAKEERLTPEDRISLKRLREIHSQQGERGKLSEVVLCFLVDYGYAATDIVEKMGLNVNEIRKIRTHDIKDMQLIANPKGSSGSNL